MLNFIMYHLTFTNYFLVLPIFNILPCYFILLQEAMPFLDSVDICNQLDGSFFETDFFVYYLLCIGWFVTFIWCLVPRSHLFLFLMLFEVVFALFSVDIAIIATNYQSTNGLLFSLIAITFSALESVTGLSFLVFYSKTCSSNFINNLSY